MKGVSWMHAVASG